ncbi:MAG: cell division protein FtsJ [SAR86 cluster bacterium BACL1 MAG-120920-bin57]|jgi:23S rRNA (uridine2552-2'-O)-methyltransferase|uniref:Ribosomal RNA large subunit methyltransferase E n=2 Tax=SAR86 cluster TaxID=62672 RepID=A0A0R2U930_9GAMM|nr:MAG: cell division protein FtsJ [SAR86 cluster bacterium BACL1 MAG-120507-bin14]KRO40966.1 MAG: cell division protein FtsJ [SAR86 cluster bacterium BACL1 MAG-120920-bin57]KRO95592.1 MAG: cell division protein FtsJ [SAR86 cluster bacterium BACL1 MAG-120820-bin45]KRO99006.1 MAG: cell division protein FtsJ [SAR86 cluster bacterium BACL1 MAG-120823-bin87]KRP00350.1 MAG: cell division protein FtsJ [SAR86 cluster bacterium BACL1 MAG-120813-bin36]KRP03312.1 MAG: cell division protein FtsJ [SAR86 c
MHADSWAIKAKQLGLRSRAVFKLEEILKKTKALKKGPSNILDIGSAPGGWSELIRLLSPSSQIFAIDLLEMDSIEGVTFFQEDIINIDQIEEISLLKKKFDLVISDLAPNLTGIRTVDEENIFDLNILTLEIATNYLKQGNTSFIIKTFQNSLLKKLRLEMEKSFQLVQTYKPAASKSKSGEIYLYGVNRL